MTPSNDPNKIPDIKKKVKVLVATYLEEAIKNKKLEATMTVEEVIILLKRIDDGSEKEVFIQ